MPGTQEGLAGLYGIDGTLAYTGIAKTVNILKNFTMTETAREATLERQGHIVGRASDMGVRRIAWTIQPYDPTNPSVQATVKSANIKTLPKLGDLVIADFGVAIFDGTWTIIGDATFTTSEQGYLEISGTAEQYLQSDGTYKALSQIG